MAFVKLKVPTGTLYMPDDHIVAIVVSPPDENKGADAETKTVITTID